MIDRYKGDEKNMNPRLDLAKPQQMVVIPSAEHGGTIAQTLFQMTSRALTRARKSQHPDSLHDAAGYLGCAHIYLDAIETTVDQIRDVAGPRADNILESILKELDWQHQTLQGVERAHDDLPGTRDLDYYTIHWYTRMHHNILNLMGMSEIDTILRDRIGQRDEWDNHNREALLMTAEMMFHQPSTTEPAGPIEDGLPAESGTTAPERRRLANESEEAHDAMAAMLQTMTQDYNESLIDLPSPRLKHHPKLCRELGTIQATPSTVQIGIRVTRQNHKRLQQVQETLDQASENNTGMPQGVPNFEEVTQWPIPYMVFAHQGRRHLKHISDPYPTGYAAERVKCHITMFLEMLEQAREDGERTEVELNVLTHLANTMGQAAQLGMHDISKEQMQRLVHTAEQEGMNKDCTCAVLNAASDGFPEVISQILEDNEAEWQKTATIEQVTALLSAAEALGISVQTRYQLAASMGYNPMDFLRDPNQTSQTALENIAMEARLAGLPEDAVMRITELNKLL